MPGIQARAPQQDGKVAVQFIQETGRANPPAVETSKQQGEQNGDQRCKQEWRVQVHTRRHLPQRCERITELQTEKSTRPGITLYGVQVFDRIADKWCGQHLHGVVQFFLLWREQIIGVCRHIGLVQVYERQKHQQREH